ncbi:translation initiation factor IF-2-like [Anastrepha obliqua]|uniref:translation initiation factor IF-2-like n=1 Tax=Anastrepha obliqua TaxID=95512 RepID=UPI0024094D55|nr:translation initiation factor IF-2-like [Anastrepha obliqua]
MAKLQIVVLCAALAFIACIAISEAEPQQRGQRVYYRPAAARYQRPRTRYLARQEEADAVPEAPAVTPYPSADELKPAVPFDEGSPATNIPDEVYGPPEANQPDEIYGPPEVDANELPADAPVEAPAADPAAEDFPAPLDEQQARLVAVRRAAALRQRQRKVAAYRQALAARAAARPLKLKAVAPRRH